LQVRFLPGVLAKLVAKESVSMPSVKDESVKDEKPMASNAVASGAQDEEPEDEKPSRQPPPARSAPSQQGFFTIYKKGQGKWTRLGTVFAAAFLGILTAYFLATDYLLLAVSNSNIRYSITAGFLAIYGLLIFWVMNKPRNADFLIATDSEMKKVNWTTQGALYGSTRVVILFLVFIALFLFVVDMLFAQFFYIISVLKTGPFSQ
jgi:preprotein translocase subunit SecE